MALVADGSASAGPPLLFEAPFLSVATFAAPTAFAVADMNGDGAPDIVVSSGGSLGFIAGHGDGTFEPNQDFGAGSYWTLAVGDVNGDGAADVVAARVDYDSITADVFLGSGAGSFDLVGRFPYPEYSFPSSIAIADIDQDGHVDLVTTSMQGRIDIFPGSGDGTFGNVRSMPCSGSAQNAVVGDLDRNGIPDMVVTRENKPSFLVYLGTGGGQFANPIDLPSGFGPVGVAIGDLNGDSNPDIAVANGGWWCGGIPTTVVQDSTVTIYLGDGAGNFNIAPSVLVGHHPWSVSLADMDGDGTADLVVGHELWIGRGCWMASSSGVPRAAAAPAAPKSTVTDPGLLVIRGRGDGTFDPMPSDRWSDLGFLVAPADLDGDGRKDIVAAHSYHAALGIVLTREDGSRGGGTTVQTTAVPDRVVVRDIEHDGLADVLVSHYETGTIETHRGSTDRVLGPAISFSAGKHPAFFAMGDLDEDGVADMAVADFGVVDSFTLTSVEPGALLVLRGSASGAFTPFGEPLLAGAINAVRIGDLNGDGHADIVAGSWAPPTISVFLGHGDGTFQEVYTRSHTGRSLTSVALGDFDGDARLDVAFAYGFAGIVVLYGAGDGALLEPIPISTRYYLSLESADLDRDGRCDLLGLGFDSFTTPDAYLSGEDGVFRRQSYAQGGQPRAAALPDLNGDGVPDLVTADAYNGVAGVSIGTGDGRFTGRVDYGAGYFPTGIDVGDIDGDGRPDLAVANSGDSSISILWGTASSTGVHQARAFLAGGQAAVSAAAGGAPTVFHLEPVAGSYRNEDVIYKSLTLHSQGTGSTESIPAQLEGITGPCCDQDQNGVKELPVPFGASDLARLFGRIEGTRTVPVELTGVLSSGQSFRASLSVKVMGAAPALQAYLVHMPTRGSTLYVTTATFGRLSVRLYDVHGRLARTVLDEPFASAGMHTAVLDGPGSSALASGVYFYRVESSAGAKSGHVVILR